MCSDVVSGVGSPGLNMPIEIGNSGGEAAPAESGVLGGVLNNFGGIANVLGGGDGGGGNLLNALVSDLLDINISPALFSNITSKQNPGPAGDGSAPAGEAASPEAAAPGPEAAPVSTAPVANAAPMPAPAAPPAAPAADAAPPFAAPSAPVAEPRTAPARFAINNAFGIVNAGGGGRGGDGGALISDVADVNVNAAVASRIENTHIA